ncbi:MAG: DNA recombination protein RmuC [Candidatus Omnitrophota bacterium]|nr:DNA recombination protein RmuC [Candidatus Omnitrophota bacterium]
MTALSIIFLIIAFAFILISLYLFKEVRKLPRDVSSSVTEALQVTTVAIGDINRSLGELKTRGERFEDFGKAINEIGNLLRPPHIRGMTGEILLEKILSDMLPSGIYQMKHTFRSGEQVDAVIKFREFILPVDSKFPLDSFKKMLECETEDDKRRCYKEFVQAVKRQVDSISRKYILPDENTFEFAFMYVPSESVYYEAVVRDKHYGEESSLLSYAAKNRVYIVSPATLFPYISTIVHGLKAFRIEENAKQILERIGALRKDFEEFKTVFDVVGAHLSDAYKKYLSEAVKRLSKVEIDISSLELRHKDEQRQDKIYEDKSALIR